MINSFPRRVQLRNGRRGIIHGTVTFGQDDDTCMLCGSHEEAGLELWLWSGRWSYRDTDHPLDIVTVFTPGGKAMAINNAPAPAP